MCNYFYFLPQVFLSTLHVQSAITYCVCYFQSVRYRYYNLNMVTETFENFARSLQRESRRLKYLR